MKKLLLAATAVLALGALSGASQGQGKKQLAFVVNGASDFWKAAEAGVKKAQTELPNYNLTFKYPEQSSAAIQTRMMDDLVAAGVAGILVSPVDPKTMGDALNRVGGQVALFTTDSDAPNSKRVVYIGSSNTDAGKQAGQLMVKALPNGGKCMGFVGLPGADNARERIEASRRSSRAPRSSWSTCAPTTSTRPAPSATSRTRSPRIPRSTAWSASTRTTRRASTRR